VQRALSGKDKLRGFKAFRYGEPFACGHGPERRFGKKGGVARRTGQRREKSCAPSASATRPTGAPSPSSASRVSSICWAWRPAGAGAYRHDRQALRCEPG
jgi:hypothetical protein